MGWVLCMYVSLVFVAYSHADYILIVLCFHLFSQLDLSFEMMLADPSKHISREEFREKVFAAEPESINTDACDFLFDVLDYNHDEVIDKNDFRIM